MPRCVPGPVWQSPEALARTGAFAEPETTTAGRTAYSRTSCWAGPTALSGSYVDRGRVARSSEESYDPKRERELRDTVEQFSAAYAA
jgi:hypothetical protein